MEAVNLELLMISKQWPQFPSLDSSSMEDVLRQHFPLLLQALWEPPGIEQLKFSPSKFIEFLWQGPPGLGQG